ncbi:bifunctional aspartate kinase/homoserine dehydrogenase I [Hymenobacter sp. BT507]|uniref:Bifunctional aspartate kinase/homoserine dehydrogenase I n=1 Tax=Hymenobacter citatus TaxID=2763506 RepID=A0ABR7MQV1_9BACT|nr:bifunctional aspartate kinase/homoserine dehydrogenase I [Hymenobacter citatus]MBC6612942.1 bifunctional aspartate kinase/homoserine dehydrogenase I [Hymenobacter citatus]
MQILKFGGSSVATAATIQQVGELVAQAAQRGPTVVVVSALGGTTDALIMAGQQAAAGQESYRQLLQTIEQRHLDAAKELAPVTSQSSLLSRVKQECNDLETLCDSVFALGELSVRTLDRLMSFGELLSARLLAANLLVRGIDHVCHDSRELIRTNSNFGNALVDFQTTNRQIQTYVRNHPHAVYVVPGFIAADAQGATTTLGRGGSDYTAAIFAGALDAEVLEIWTDVSGMMTADPRLVRQARPIPRISYQEAMELSHFGAKVLYPPTIQPVRQRGIPLLIKNTFAPADEGTRVEVAPPATGEVVRGLSSIGQVTLLRLEGGGMVGIPGFSMRLFAALAREKVNVILITQSSSEYSICVAVRTADAVRAKAATDDEFAFEIGSGKVDPLVVEADLAIVALVGEKMKDHPNVSGRLFNALGNNGVNIRAIAQGSSEKNISVVVRAQDVRKAINVLHESFFEVQTKQVNLFVVGAGNVGGKLLEQLSRQRAYLLRHLRLQVRVVGVANSRRFAFAEQGLELGDWRGTLAQSEEGTLADFLQVIKSKNLRNTIFVDVTASGEVARCYPELLSRGAAVVACNKIAGSAELSYYQQLKRLSREFGAAFLFETNVGAGLPIIGTLNDLTRSGDEVHRIEAVLSGTLNFVFNHYDASVPFAEVVRQAQAEGYTEPDPRLDLSGVDVARKILILAREAGQELEMSDIENEAFLPASCMEGSVEDFYQEMARQESHFQRLYREAADAGKQLRFVARYADAAAAVGLQAVGPDHDFYSLQGKDNAVLFYTARYPEQPLVVKGAGAGADVTASGVFADIMRATRQ